MKLIAEFLGPVLYRVFRPLKAVPGLHKVLRFGYYELMAVIRLAEHRIRKIGRGSNAKAVWRRQAGLRHTIPEFPGESWESLVETLERAGIAFSTGAHTIYLPPQAGLDRILGDVPQSYPPDAGYKILKNFGPPESAQYLVDGFIHSRTELKITGSLHDMADAANTLTVLGLGPRLYDLVELRAGSRSLSCFVVEHVDGTLPSPEEHRAFLEQVQSFADKGFYELASIAGIRDDDFIDVPGCNGNLWKAKGNGALHYVDFQQFLPAMPKMLQAIADEGKSELHFGDTFLTQGKQAFLYQEVPGLSAQGKRDTAARWETIRAMLQKADIGFSDRVVMDICCNAGLMMGLALQEGASWAIGWDMPGVTHQAGRLMQVLGATRHSLVGAELGQGYAIDDDIPDWLQPRIDGAVVFYLAAVRHIGLMRALGNVPWRAMVFEGHQGDTEAETDAQLTEAAALWGVEVAVRTQFADHSGTRPLALLVRRDNRSGGSA